MKKNDLTAIFLSHVASSPDKLAIMTTETSVTYQQLFAEVVYWKALFSQHLQGRVVVCLERTPRLVSVLIALQWLEITYIPVALSVPIERLRTIIEDSQAHAILYDNASPYLSDSSLPCLKIDLTHPDSTVSLSDSLERNLNHAHQGVEQSSIAYIIYTSGSTGTPKGVAISRGALNNFLESMSLHFLKEQHELLLATTTIGFDIAALELYLPLWQQKTIFLANDEQHTDISSISKLLNDYPITLLQATPSVWSVLETLEWAGKSDLVALCGGEALPYQLAQRLLAEVSELWNMYGPTEATIWCSIKQMRPHEPITIGHPIDNMEMMVMDASLQKLPPYAKGELFIGGLGLAEGYVNNDKLTQSQFIPYTDVPGGRLYRAGDIACTTPNGEFIVFGRTDNQIKMHGYRIELEEIEAKIHTISVVRECAVIADKEQLVAYICLTTQASLTDHELIKHLSPYLPGYMLPNRIVFLDALPLTPSGKVNRKALANLVVLKTAEATDNIELTPSQALITRIWAEEFKLPSVNLNDNFFELGGHSLLAERILLKLEQQTEKHISLYHFYRSPTIMQLAQVVEHTPRESQKQINSLMVKNNRWFPLNDFQLMFWISNIFEPSLKALRVTDRRRIQGTINKEALDSALQFILQKHEAFSYAINRFYPAQKKCEKSSIQWIETSLLDCDSETAESLLNMSFDELSNPPQHFLTAPMIIAKLIYLKRNQVELQVSMSHFISDNMSMELFFQDLSNAYLYYAHQSALNTKQPTQSPISYAMNQKDHVTQYESLDAAFWKRYLQDTGLFSFPNKYVVQHDRNKTFQFSTYIEIPEGLLTGLHQFCIENAVTTGDVLCAAVGLSLKRCCNDEITQPHQLVMNNVKSTRDDPSYDDVIGCFLSNHLIKIDLNKSNTLASLSQQVQLSSIETAGHQRAASLIKLASIGNLPRTNGRLRRAAISIAIRLFSKISHWMNISPVQLEACKTLSSTDRRKDFLINVNILNNFIADKIKPRLFGKPCTNIPMYHHDLSMIQHVLDINFLRYGPKNKAFVVISANLTPEFRHRLGMTLLDVLRNKSDSNHASQNKESLALS